MKWGVTYALREQNEIIMRRVWLTVGKPYFICEITLQIQMKCCIGVLKLSGEFNCGQQRWNISSSYCGRNWTSHSDNIQWLSSLRGRFEVSEMVQWDSNTFYWMNTSVSRHITICLCLDTLSFLKSSSSYKNLVGLHDIKIYIIKI